MDQRRIKPVASDFVKEALIGEVAEFGSALAEQGIDGLANVEYVSSSETKQGAVVRVKLATKPGRNFRIVVIEDDPDIHSVCEEIA